MDRVDVGGAEVLLLNMFRHLDPAVVTPRLICFKRLGALGPEFEAAGFPVEVIGRGGRYDVRTVFRLVRRFRRDTDVVLVTHMHRAPLTIGRLAAWLSRRPSVVAPHGMDTVTFRGRRCLPRHDVQTLFLSDAMVLLAPSQGRYLRRHEGVNRNRRSRIREVVIPNGVPLPPPATPADRIAARVELDLDEDDLVVGIVARLELVKAHEVLLEAIARLAPGHPRLRLVCIGDGEREAELVTLTDALGITDRVRFAGLRRDVARLLPGFDIACLTSRFECAPLTVIEAMAAGVPVVVTDVGAVRDMVTDGGEGYLVEPGDSAALADRIELLAADRELRARLGAAGRARAERQFRIEDTAAGFERLLASLVRSDAVTCGC
ncbi:MAG: glycosyltransferase [Pseudonocardia sp.]